VDGAARFADVAALAPVPVSKRDVVKRGKERSFAIRDNETATIEFGSSIQQGVASASVSQSDARSTW
jgi:hypothetical protein